MSTRSNRLASNPSAWTLLRRFRSFSRLSISWSNFSLAFFVFYRPPPIHTHTQVTTVPFTGGGWDLLITAESISHYLFEIESARTSSRVQDHLSQHVGSELHLQVLVFSCVRLACPRCLVLARRGWNGEKCHC